MSSNEPTGSSKLGLDQRGVAYVESIGLIVIGLCIAGAILSAGNLLFTPRFQRGVDTLYSGVP